MAPQYVIERLGAIAGPDALYVAGVGQHQMWAAQFISYENPGTWMNSGGLGTMGFAVPAAMGAKVGRPEATVWAIDGDGCFQMTNQELATCAIEGIPIKVAVINNASLGMVRQWQTLFYNARYSNTDLDSRRIPDYAKLAEAYGAWAFGATPAADVDATIEGMAVDDRPVVIDFESTATPWCGRWCPPEPATTTSRSRAAWRRTGTARTERDDEQAPSMRSWSRTSPGPGQDRRAVLAPGLQHRLPGGRAHRTPVSVPDDRRRRRRGPAARAGRKQLNKLVNVIKMMKSMPASRCNASCSCSR